MYMQKKHLLLLIFLLVVIVCLGLVPIMAQSNEIILTVAIEEWQQNFFDDDMFAEFEAAHPDVKVLTVIIPQDERYFATPSTVEDVPEFIENAANLAEQADLLLLQSFGSNRMMTRAKAYLDITPLLNADPNANLDDFYSPMLQSFQWDGGTWGLPISGSVQILIYNKTRFDELSLSYPNESWTFNDYLSVGRELTVYDANGEVEIPGFFGFDTSLFLQTAYGRSLADLSAFPSQPLLTDPELIEFVAQWAAFQDETSPDGFNFDFQEIPMTIQGTFFLNSDFGFGSGDVEWAGTLLPNGTAGIQTQGYAISAGTQYPELSYELLQFMTSSPDMTSAFFGGSPARQSMQGITPDDSPIGFSELSPEVQELNDLALENAIPASETDFYSYIYTVVNKINEDGLDAETALLEVQENAIEVLQAIDEQSMNTIIAVATPVPTPILSSGEVSLTFGMEVMFSPLPNRELWNNAIDEFVAQDPQVGQIVLNTEFMQFDERIETQDCFYLSSNIVPQANLSQLLNVDPFLAADPNFDPNDIVNGALEQLTRDNAIWAVPFSLDPLVMWYDPNIFAEAGLPEPSNDWTIFDFIDTMQQLQANTSEAPYKSQDFGGTYIHMLIAAHGGNLIDYSTVPYTINLTDPANLEATRQVLNLARDGYIDYQELGSFGGGGFGGEQPLFDALLQPYGYRFQNRGEEFGQPHRVVLFPRGTTYTPMSYSLGGGYISANTPAPEACYRFMSYIAEHPELLFGMPAKRSQFEAAVEQIQDSEDVAALYNSFDAALQEPNALVIPNAFGRSFVDPTVSYINFLTTMWINRAFDRYVLEDADLDFELAQAEQFIGEFQACVADIPASDRPLSQLSNEESQSYFQQFQDCAVGVDPSLNELFGGNGSGGGD